jgi:hypothetical protein
VADGRVVAVCPHTGTANNRHGMRNFIFFEGEGEGGGDWRWLHNIKVICNLGKPGHCVGWPLAHTVKAEATPAELKFEYEVRARTPLIVLLISGDKSAGRKEGRSTVAVSVSVKEGVSWEVTSDGK